MLETTREAARAFGLPTKKGGAFTSLPSVLLLRKGGVPLLWVEGYEMKVADMLRRAAGVKRI